MTTPEVYYYIVILLYYYNVFVVLYFVAINSIYLLLNFLSFFEIKEYVKVTRILRPEIMFRSNFFIPVSVIVPAYNESSGIVESVKSLLQLHYPEFEIIVVNDGSKDGTLDAMKNAYKMAEVFFEPGSSLPCKPVRGIYISSLHRNLILIDKDNGGKADALNAGINFSKYQHFCGLDADSILESKSIMKISRPMLEDNSIIAAGGIVRVINGCETRRGEVIDIDLPRGMLANFQIVEYLRAFLFGRTGWSVLNAMLIVSGAFGLFKKREVIEAGGYRTDTVGEDMELIVRLHNIYGPSNKIKVKFVPDPVCFTEVPESLSVLSRQRNRWQRGLIDSIMLNRNMIMNPRYGLVGMLAMPFFVLFEMLGPLIEVAGYLSLALSLYLGVVDFTFALLFFTVSVSMGITLSASSILLEEISFRRYPGIGHVLVMFAYAILENFGYRQLNTYYRFRGTIDYLLGMKHWGEMSRKGFRKEGK